MKRNTNLQAYFQNEMYAANGADGYNNFGGGVGSWADEDYSNFADSGTNYARNAYNPFQYADGGAPQAAPTSLPYIFTVQNTTTATIAAVTVLNANVALFSGDTTGFGNTAGIVIASGTTGVSYIKLLSGTQTEPFRVGTTYISSATAAQIQKQYSVVQINKNGARQDIPITPTIDPYQLQSGVLTNNTQYIVNGDTSIVISEVLASTTVQFNIYPTNTTSMARPLADAAPVAAFGNPQVVRNQKLQLTGGSMAALRGGM